MKKATRLCEAPREALARSASTPKHAKRIFAVKQPSILSDAERIRYLYSAPGERQKRVAAVTSGFPDQSASAKINMRKGSQPPFTEVLLPESFPRLSEVAGPEYFCERAFCSRGSCARWRRPADLHL